MIQKVLLPLDGSRLAETVLPFALAFAQATNSSVILVHVLQTTGDQSESHTVDPLDWRLRKLEASLYLEEISELFSNAGIEAEPVLLLGDAAGRIVEFAQERNVDLIMMSSHGRSGLSSWNMSSVVQKVIVTTHTSVMLVPAYHARNESFGDLHYRRIVVPLDGSQRAEFVLPLVRALGRGPDGGSETETLLVTAVARPEMPRRAPLSPEDNALAEKVVARNRVEAEKYLAQLESRMDNKASTHLLISDDVIESLHDFVRQQEADLLIFSAHGYSGNGKRRYGSVVTSFITYGSTPMLIVQDVPRHEFKKTQAEVAAQEKSDSGMGVRTVVNAPAGA